jgi:DNA-directed RNA polymerase subunit RPC12/RpoP
MSFEGFYQVLCEKGHQYTLDVYGDPKPEKSKCVVCGGKANWWNLVDTTNGSWDDKGKRIDGLIKLRVNTKAKKKTCPYCGYTRVVKVATYKIPYNKYWPPHKEGVKLTPSRPGA